MGGHAGPRHVLKIGKRVGNVTLPRRFIYACARSIFSPCRRKSMPWQHGVDARSKRVLIVEDELMIRMLLEDMLAELGYRLCRARAARALPQPAAAEEAFSDR
jgi:hypothetical protein